MEFIVGANPHWFTIDDVAFADSLSPMNSLKKTKRPNLIAKLMGVEEFPSKPFQTTSKKHLEGGKTMNRNRPLFGIDILKVRKSQSVVQKVDLEWRMLKATLKPMQFGGFLKCNPAKGHESQAHALVLVLHINFKYVEYLSIPFLVG